MSCCSSARSSLEEPFGRRGVQRFLKITPWQDRNNKLLSSSAGLEAGPRQLLPGPSGVPCSWTCRGGHGSSPHRPGASIAHGMAPGDADALPGSGGARTGSDLGKSLRKWGWSPRRSWRGERGHSHVVSSFSTGSGLEVSGSVGKCWVSAECQQHLLLQRLLKVSPKASLLLPFADPAPVLGFACRGSGKCHVPGGPTRWDLLAR